MTSLCPGTVFHSSGLNHYSTPTPPSATPSDIDRQLSRKPFNGRDWPRDSPVARVYDVGNSTTKLVLFNKRLKKHSHLRGLTDFSGDIVVPSPSRHIPEEPAVNKSHHEVCLDSTSERFQPRISLDLGWKNSTQRPPSTFDNGSPVNRKRHISCRVPRDQTLGGGYCRRPYSSASMYSQLGSLWPVVNDPDLSLGERRYLLSIAFLYNVNPLKQMKQEQYSQLLYKEVLRGHYSPELQVRYLKYLTSPRKTQCGKLEAENNKVHRTKSAPPPALTGEREVTTPSKASSEKTASGQSRGSQGSTRSLTLSTSSQNRPASTTNRLSALGNGKGQSASSRTRSASTGKSVSSKKLTNDQSKTESNDTEAAECKCKSIKALEDDVVETEQEKPESEKERINRKDYSQSSQTSLQSKVHSAEEKEIEGPKEEERTEDAPVKPVVSENHEPSKDNDTSRHDTDTSRHDTDTSQYDTDTSQHDTDSNSHTDTSRHDTDTSRHGHVNRENERIIRRGTGSGSSSSVETKSSRRAKEPQLVPSSPKGRTSSDAEQEVLSDQENTDHEDRPLLHKAQGSEQVRQLGSSHFQHENSNPERTGTGENQEKDHETLSRPQSRAADNKYPISSSPNSNQSETFEGNNTQDELASLSADQHKWATEQDKGQYSDDAPPDLSTQGRNHDIDKIEY